MHCRDTVSYTHLDVYKRQDHGGVVLAPGLEGFDDVPLNAGILEEHPRFIDEEGFENG